MTKLLLTMPQPGETITEGLIVSWLAKPGDALSAGSPVAELETEKAVFVYESPYEGTLLELKYDGGARVKVGLPIAVMEVAAEKAEHYMMLGLGRLADGETAPVTAADPKAPKGSAAPYVRKLARARGLNEADLTRLASGHPEGRVTLAALEASTPSTGHPIPPHAHAPPYTAVPCSPIRQRIAEKMVLSKSKIPHAHTGLAIDVSRVMKQRAERNAEFSQRTGTHLSLITLIKPALERVLRQHPVVNASYVEKAGGAEIHLFKEINLGIAVGTEHGLLIPVIHRIDSLSQEEFNAQLASIIRRAMDKRLSVDELTGATIVFNNFGFYGTSIGVQIISHPLTATLGMGVIEKRVVPVGNDIAVHEMADFVLAFDHRAMDGRDVGLFLSDLKKEIESL
jgi:pyruvate/2-oxoglutarate dehydrogenase complex dihydrolipoamide acyltransferase (E2) component